MSEVESTAVAQRRHLIPAWATIPPAPTYTRYWPMSDPPVQIVGRPLTLRKREILVLIADGQSYKEIGALLGISPVTVRAHAEDMRNRIRGAAGGPLEMLRRYADLLLGILPVHGQSDAAKLPPPTKPTTSAKQRAAWQEWAKVRDRPGHEQPRECQCCGAVTRRLAGHHVDYDMPLEVIWLCGTCHRQVHKRDGSVARTTSAA